MALNELHKPKILGVFMSYYFIACFYYIVKDVTCLMISKTLLLFLLFFCYSLHINIMGSVIKNLFSYKKEFYSII